MDLPEESARAPPQLYCSLVEYFQQILLIDLQIFEFDGV